MRLCHSVADFERASDVGLRKSRPLQCSSCLYRDLESTSNPTLASLLRLQRRGARGFYQPFLESH